MTAATQLRYLRVVLILVGLIFLFGVYPLMMMWWPSGWRWQPNQPEYEQMILGVYATLGVFLLIASRNPMQHRSLIWFTVWSSLVHAGIMTAQALNAPAEHGHLMGDIPALVIVAVALAILRHAARLPRRLKPRRCRLRELHSAVPAFLRFSPYVHALFPLLSTARGNLAYDLAVLAKAESTALLVVPL